MRASAIARTSVALLSCMAAVVSSQADAQKYDGAGLLRFGAFGQIGSHTFDVTRPADVAGSLSASSGGGGVTFGYDWLFHSHWLLGVESDIAADSWSRQRERREHSVDYIATLRGRLGAYVRPDLLIYGTAGVAGLGVGFKGLFDPLTQSRFTENQTLIGWTAGAGMEYEWRGMVLFGEYLFASYETLSFFELRPVDQTVTAVKTDVDIDQHIFRFGVKFIIGHDYRPEYGPYGSLK